MKKYKTVLNEQGFSILEVLVAFAVLGLVAVGVSTLGSQYLENTLRAKVLGEEQDARQYVRFNFDCKATVMMERNTCKKGGLIKGYNAQGKAMMTSAVDGMDFNGTKVRFNCANDGVSINIIPEIRHKGNSTFHKLFEVPIACKICGVDITSDPMTFPPPPYPRDTAGLVAYYNKISSECGDRGITGSDPIRRSTGASQKGKDQPFQTGTLDAATHLKICNYFGFDNFVTSTCVNGPGDFRCNYTSPHNNNLQFWNGRNWQGSGNCEYMSWMATITCKDISK